MRKFKLIKSYPGSPALLTVVKGPSYRYTSVGGINAGLHKDYINSSQLREEFLQYWRPVLDIEYGVRYVWKNAGTSENGVQMPDEIYFSFTPEQVNLKNESVVLDLDRVGEFENHANPFIIATFEEVNEAVASGAIIEAKNVRPQYTEEEVWNIKTFSLNQVKELVSLALEVVQEELNQRLEDTANAYIGTEKPE